MSTSAEYFAALRDTISHLAAHDTTCARFGARHHRYRVGPPLTAARLAAIEAELGLTLPEDYRDHLHEISDGGAGPYHGLMPLDHPAQRDAARGTFPLDGPTSTADAPAGRALYQGVVGLSHLGCGYVAFLVVRGEAAGQVWLDARGSDDGVHPIYPCFRDLYLAWIDALVHNRLPRAFVTPGRCALPSALTSYLHAVEQRAGIEPGTLDDAALREALDAIGPGGIASAETGDTPFFERGDAVDLCPVCEQTVENLLSRGLRRDQIAPGLPPIPQRSPKST